MLVAMQGGVRIWNTIKQRESLLSHSLQPTKYYGGNAETEPLTSSAERTLIPCRLNPDVQQSEAKWAEIGSTSVRNIVWPIPQT